MKDAQPGAIYLKDYQEPDYWIDKTDLSFDLVENETRVTARLQFRLNQDRHNSQLPPLVLHGNADMKLDLVKVDGVELTPEQYTLTSETLTLPISSDRFETEIVSVLAPQDNTSMEGLYKSGGMYCTQCEAEGFRRITWYLDRPDVMSLFTTRITADKAKYPVLLSNGNCIEQGETEDGRHWKVWEDPFKKPAYLFALVAGNLVSVEDTFTTQSGRDVTLQIFTESHNITKCDHAMRSLKQSMRWDEEVYGREYDLDIFMIVAVDDFNMGAMENKGLNIFNSSCVLARADTATDATFQRIEAIVAHEYFHNWSGNRVTCRDWFQLSLKEGFTVFRDSEFSADMNSRTVKRIEDVNHLRSAQFAEDAGPMAHPVRPSSFIEISNFYTLTVYEKGAEIVRMIHNLVGKDGFRKGSDLYFERHDGQAVTCEDFVRAMEDANGVDLSQFMRWYTQAGTPVLDVADSYDADNKRYVLEITQSCPTTPGQEEKEPFHIPLGIGLLSPAGVNLPVGDKGETTTVLEVREASQQFVFENMAERPLPSLLRGFSAPVRLNYDYSREDLLFLMRHDEDGFNRWDSCQRLATDTILDLVRDIQAANPLSLDSRLIEAWRELLEDETADKAMVAEMLSLPSEQWLSEQMAVIDVYAIHEAREFVRGELAKSLSEPLQSLYRGLAVEKPYKPEAEDIAERQLKNICLGYLTELDTPAMLVLAETQFNNATNMTDQMAALSCVVNGAHQSALEKADALLSAFHDQWKGDANVMDMWLSVQVSGARMGSLERVKKLMEHPVFDYRNPNKLRSLIGAFCMRNLKRFHDLSGEGYAFLADNIIRLDKQNPQIAARMLTPLTRWRRYDEQRVGLMKGELERIQANELSKDVFEVVSKSLA
ncbi:aminopeptidase N [Kistimonas scapharcae]|uniref:Aminopeptidase N n=1 Tax=Kistimonas scapharcae TaxID=1036133 RepID=A0ABP8UXW6_9GAMM